VSDQSDPQPHLPADHSLSSLERRPLKYTQRDTPLLTKLNILRGLCHDLFERVSHDLDELMVEFCMAYSRRVPVSS
jgi:hypothetical protein